MAPLLPLGPSPPGKNAMKKKVLITLLWALWSASASAGEITDAEFGLVETELASIVKQSSDPLGLPSLDAEAEAPVGRPRLIIARSILSLVAGVDTMRMIPGQDVLTSLSTARNLGNLARREWALSWYERTDELDRDDRYAHDILKERMGLIRDLGDSSRVASALLELTHRDDAASLSPVILDLTQSFNFLNPGKVHRDIAQAISAMPNGGGAELALECARIWQRAGDSVRALAYYRALIANPGELDIAGRAWIVRGLADCLYVLGRNGEAGRMYNAIRSADLGDLSAWATFQLGALASVAGHHGDAVNHFKSICQRETDTPWREAACWRLAQAENLKEIDDALREVARSIPLR